MYYIFFIDTLDKFESTDVNNEPQIESNINELNNTIVQEETADESISGILGTIGVAVAATATAFGAHTVKKIPENKIDE